jgi:hypothetical protein
MLLLLLLLLLLLRLWRSARLRCNVLRHRLHRPVLQLLLRHNFLLQSHRRLMCRGSCGRCAAASAASAASGFCCGCSRSRLVECGLCSHIIKGIRQHLGPGYGP